MCPFKPWHLFWILSALGLLWGRAVASSSKILSALQRPRVYIACPLDSFLGVRVGFPNSQTWLSRCLNFSFKTETQYGDWWEFVAWKFGRVAGCGSVEVTFLLWANGVAHWPGGLCKRALCLKNCLGSMLVSFKSYFSRCVGRASQMLPTNTVCRTCVLERTTF